MENILLVLLVLFNIWTMLYLMHEKEYTERSGEDTGMEKRKQPDIMGRSLFKMPPKVADTARRMPQAASSPESEAVDERDVTFADGNAGETRQEREGKPSARIPDERLDEVFKNMTVKEAGTAYADDDGEEYPEPQAGGTSFEDIDKAVGTLKNPEATRDEALHAGKVLSEMEGNELFSKLTESPEIAERIRMVFAICLDCQDGNMNIPDASFAEVEKAASSKKASELPDTIEEFNALDYL